MPDRTPTSLVTPQARARASSKIDTERRSELLARVQDIILAEGFARLTVDELASRLQCSKSTLYAVSSSKERLVADAIRNFLEEAMHHVDEKVAGVTEPAEEIQIYLTAVGTEMQRMSQACFEDLGSNDTTREIYVAHSAGLRRRICEFLDAGIDAGRFRPVPVKFVSEAVSLLIDGIQWGRLLVAGQFGDLNGEMTLSEAYEALSDFVLASVTNVAEGTPN